MLLKWFEEAFWPVPDGFLVTLEEAMGFIVFGVRSFLQAALPAAAGSLASLGVGLGLYKIGSSVSKKAEKKPDDKKAGKPSA